MIVVEPAASKLLRGLPSALAKCFAKREVIETIVIDKMGRRIVWGVCINECSDAFWSNEYDVILDTRTKIDKSYENKTSIQPLKAPVDVLGAIACKQWLGGI